MFAKSKNGPGTEARAKIMSALREHSRPEGSKKMSLVGKFDDDLDRSFAGGFDRDSARRQLRVSAVLVVAMALAAFVLGFAMPVHAPQSGKTTAINHDSGFTGRLVTIDAH
jgi:hypothetical protein